MTGPRMEALERELAKLGREREGTAAEGLERLLGAALTRRSENPAVVARSGIAASVAGAVCIVASLWSPSPASEAFGEPLKRSLSKGIDQLGSLSEPTGNR